MRYFATIDEDNYVLSLANNRVYDEEVEVELTPTEDEWMFLNCYKLINGSLILDSVKKQKILDNMELDKLPTWEETIEAQITYTALMTDTLLEE